MVLPVHALSLPREQTGHWCHLWSFPKAGAWRVAVSHTSPSGRVLELSRHPVGPQRSWVLTTWGERLHLHLWEPIGRTAVWTWSLSCCFRLHRLCLWGLRSVWSWLSLSAAKPVAKTHSRGSSPVLVRCPAGRLITAFPFQHSHEPKFILLHCSLVALVKLVCKVFRLQLN